MHFGGDRPHVKEVALHVPEFAVHRYIHVFLSDKFITYEKSPQGASRKACIYVDSEEVQY
jgi:hypothetical protein